MNVNLSNKKFKKYFSHRKGKRRYNIKLWKTFTDCFNCLPVAAIIDDKIFCMHGGLSPELTNMEQIRRIIRPTDVPDTGFKKEANFRVIRYLKDFYAISYGQTLIKMSRDGLKVKEEFPTSSVLK